MSALALGSQLKDADGVYRALIEAHRGLTPDESARVNARLILILANQVGDDAAVLAAIALAAKGENARDQAGRS